MYVCDLSITLCVEVIYLQSPGRHDFSECEELNNSVARAQLKAAHESWN